MIKENLHFTGKLKAKDFALRSVAVGAAVLSGLFAGSDKSLESQEPFGAQKFSVDMNPQKNPGNTKISVGSREECARINENNKLDANEDFVDGIEFDLTATEIPKESKMIAFSFSLKYRPGSFGLIGRNVEGLLSTAPGYSGLDVSEQLPSYDGDYVSGVADINVQGAFGSGFLARLKLETTANAKSGNYDLQLYDAMHVDQMNNSWAPAALEGGRVAINQDCQPISPATETPNPTIPAMSDQNQYTDGPRELPGTGGRPY